MIEDEVHLRVMNLNAHFAWALAMWGSADIAREDRNYLLAVIGYYYAVFHAGFALANTNHTIHLESMKQVGHSQLESWLTNLLPTDLVLKFQLLREIRETINYLGGETPAHKLRIVRGHPFGFDLGSTKYSFFDSVSKARDESLTFIYDVLSRIEAFCKENGWSGPKRHDENWLDEYLQEDVFLHIIPHDGSGPRILQRALSVLEID